MCNRNLVFGLEQDLFRFAESVLPGEDEGLESMFSNECCAMTCLQEHCESTTLYNVILWCRGISSSVDSLLHSSRVASASLGLMRLQRDKLSWLSCRSQDLGR